MVDLQAARVFAVEEYKSSEEYNNMRDDLYSTCIEDAMKLIGLKNPKLDVSDLNDGLATIEEAPEKESEVAEQ